MDLPTLRRRGVEPVLGDALAHLLRPGGPEGFLVHLDVDVLDEAVMPAVDYRLPDGLTWDELATVLRAAVATGHVAGLDIAIFNPTLDRDGRIARALVDTLVAGLT